MCYYIHAICNIVTEILWLSVALSQVDSGSLFEPDEPFVNRLSLSSVAVEAEP